MIPTRRVRSTHREFQMTARRERLFVLRDLIPLGQVRIEVVLASKDRTFLDRAVQGEAGFDGFIDGLSIEDWQRSR